MGPNADVRRMPRIQEQHPAGFLHFHAQVLHDASGGHHVRILDLVTQDAGFLAQILRSPLRQTCSGFRWSGVAPASTPPPPPTSAAAAAATAAAVAATAPPPPPPPSAADDGSAYSTAAKSIGQVESHQTAVDAERSESPRKHLQSSSAQSRLNAHDNSSSRQSYFFLYVYKHIEYQLM